MFTALLQELNIQAVLDVTPGSGACMEAALTLGLPYHGFCINKDHMAWLQSVADRAACGIISVSGSSLYAQDLATAVKQQFPDLLQSLVPANDEDDEPLEPDSPADNWAESILFCPWSCGLRSRGLSFMGETAMFILDDQCDNYRQAL